MDKTQGPWGENTPADIYANIRNKALEEAAILCDGVWASAIWTETEFRQSALNCSKAIRALKTKEPA